MALTTRCPQCGTAFKVVADQLRVRDGFVRCGVCSTVFDGSARLVTPSIPRSTTPPAPLTPVQVAPVSPPSVLRDRSHLLRQTDEVPEGADEDEDDFGRVILQRESSLRQTNYQGQDDGQRWRAAPAAAEPTYHDSFHIGERVPVRPPVTRYGQADTHPYPGPYQADQDDEDQHEPERPFEPVRGESRTRHVDAIDSGRAPPEFLDEDRHARRRVWAVLWGLLCLIALVALGAQWIYVYRTDIATEVPLLRPILQSVCVQIKCEVGYTRHIERISVESSSLQPQIGNTPGEAGKTRLLLKAVLRNRYDMPQPLPSLILELTDFSGSVVVRKILPPAAYLPAPRASKPFGPGEQIALAVPIDVVGVTVTGYQIDKFFP